jgi:hypothetical protein
LLATYTVLDVSNDPFPVDTAARHRDGRWLAEAFVHLGLARGGSISAASITP